MEIPQSPWHKGSGNGKHPVCPELCVLKILPPNCLGSGYARTQGGPVLFTPVIITSATAWEISLAEKQLATVIRRKLGEE